MVPCGGGETGQALSVNSWATTPSTILIGFSPEKLAAKFGSQCQHVTGLGFSFPEGRFVSRRAVSSTRFGHPSAKCIHLRPRIGTSVFPHTIRNRGSKKALDFSPCSYYLVVSYDFVRRIVNYSFTSFKGPRVSQGRGGLRLTPTSSFASCSIPIPLITECFPLLTTTHPRTPKVKRTGVLF
jgi:hypothetical protein